MRKTVDADSVPQDHSPTIPEIRAGEHHKAIVTGENLNGMLRMDTVELEKFMHEEVEIEMAEFPNDSGLVGIPLSVEEDTQWVLGGQRAKIRRKYVEVLAHARTQNFRQSRNPMNPAEDRPVGRTVLSYPFSVINDTPKGRAWLKELLSQPA